MSPSYTIKQKIEKANLVVENMKKYQMTAREASKSVGIHPTSFYRWSREIPELDWIEDWIKANAKARHALNAEKVELTLVQKALGYIRREQEFKVPGKDDHRKPRKDGLVLAKETIKPVAGDITAIIFLLCNLAREGLTSINWQNVQDIQIDSDKLKSVDELITKMFKEDEKAISEGKKRKEPKILSASLRETPEERRIREKIRLEMQG